MIVLGWPHKALSPNFRSRSHWPKTRALKAAREAGFYAAKAVKLGLPAGEGITLSFDAYPPDRRVRDRDNILASLKGHLDGIADALKVNDSVFRCLPPVIREPVKGGKIVVTIE